MRMHYRIGSTYQAPRRAAAESALVRGLKPAAAPAARAAAAPARLRPAAAAAMIAGRALRAPGGLLKGLAGVAVLAGAAGCASFAPDFARWKVEPLVSVTQMDSSSTGYYALGRQHDSVQAWDQAIEAYRKAVIVDTRNIEAYNALGVALARAGQLAAAEATLRQALVIAPDRHHVRANLGQVLMRAGRPAEALDVLEQAARQDPGNAVTAANLHQARARLGASGPVHTAVPDARPATIPVAQPVALPMIGLPVLVELPPPITVAALPQPPALQLIDRPTIPSLQQPPAARPATTLAGNTAEAAPRSVAAAATATATAPAEAPAPRLEVSNGNGVTGMAARIARWLAADGLHHARLTNQRPYVQQHTTIQYRSGHEATAQQVARTLRAADSTLAGAPTAGLRSDVRVVLGRDWVVDSACSDGPACRPVIAALPARRGE